MSQDKAKERLGKADIALSEHFTSAVGVKAQRYEPAITGGDSAREVAVMSPRNLHQLAQHLVVDGMLSELPMETRTVLWLVYAHGTDALWQETGAEGEPVSEKPTGLVMGKNNAPDPLGLLRIALAPTWGHGSYLRVAVACERARRTFSKRYPDAVPSASAVLDFLAFEAGKGSESAGMLAKVREECEELRDRALTDFDLVRVAALKRAKEAREAKEARVEQQAEVVRDRARIRRQLPACLQMTDEERERFRSAALSFLARQEGS